MGFFKPSKSRQTEASRQAASNTTRGSKRPNDAEWRRIRMIESRLATLEAAQTAIRRDVNRIDRKGYREAAREAPRSDVVPGDAGYRVPNDILKQLMG